VVPSHQMVDAYTAAMRILNYRFNSEAELRRKLRSKKYEPAAIDKAIERLRREKWLDDERFAGAFVRTRANKRVGRGRILRELQAAGVDDAKAAQAVAENIDEERERVSLEELCAKRARVLVRRHGAEFLNTSEGRNKLTVYLLNQGYDAGQISDAVRNLKLKIEN
ncbi:MAG: recombination regulator RecX, partial [Acidobacteriota bacterium]|nr:recombination regulator RecX [Acidobacteriota bacterium]